MIREFNEQRRFALLKGRVVNPYIGFTSFQRFRGDPLYSDIVVKPENNGTETEAVECYPVPNGVEQNGDIQGFYPNTEIAYIRILWKEFEPRRKEYNYALIEDILQKAKAKGQTVMFRLLPHSTRESDDVPDWLKTLIPCPERPKGKRVKDSPSDPVYLEYLGEAIEKIAERFDDDPTLDIMDVSITGAWGEGHMCWTYPKESLQKLMDVYTRSFKHTHLIGQVAAPWLVDYANQTKPCGWRGDGVGEEYHMLCYYPNVSQQMPKDAWKNAPIAFESFWWLGEWERRGWDIDEIIERTLRWHISNFNAKSLPIPEKWRDKIEYWLSKMGYHFALRVFDYPNQAEAGDIVQFRIYMENRGVAPIYHKVPLRIRLYNTQNAYDYETDIDIRKWLPGDNIEDFEITLSKDIQCGEYDIELIIAGEASPVIQLEMQTDKNGDFYKIGKIVILGNA